MSEVAVQMRAWASSPLLAVAAFLLSATLCAAEYQPVPYEEWSGFYACEANERDPERWPGYRAQVRMLVHDGRASIVRESPRVRETMSGEVSPDGRLELQGMGEWKGGASWRWTYQGRFVQQRFQAQGAMLSQAGTRLRVCSMSLTRVAAASGPDERPQVARAPAALEAAPDQTAATREKAAPALRGSAASVPSATPLAPGAAPAVAVKAPKPEVPVAAPATPAAAAGRQATTQPEASAPAGIDVTLELAPNTSARREGVVSHGAADRYQFDAQSGQLLAVELDAPEGGVQFDVYGPGAVVRRDQTALVVQGARLFSGVEGVPYQGELAADGTHLVLVRSAGERARYSVTITLTETQPASAVAQPPAAQIQPQPPDAPGLAVDTRAAADGRIGPGTAAVLLIVAAASMVALLQRRRALSTPARYAAIGLIAASGIALLVISGRAPREPVKTAAEAPAVAAAPAQALSSGAEPAQAAAAATLVGGTFVCSVAQAGETSLVSTFKYYPDGIYIELARTSPDRAPMLTAVKLGSFEWAEGKTLTLTQTSASPNIEYGEPFVKTSVVETRSVSGGLARGYSARVTARTVAGKPQRVAEVREECVRDERAGPAMDRLREELRAHLPRLTHSPVAAAKSAAAK
jgi:hypothetical protein